MTQDDNEMLNEFLRAVVYSIGVLGLVILFVSIFDTFKQTPKEQSSKFKIVDTYKGCDVVRWENTSLSEYKYFLYCNSKEK